MALVPPIEGSGQILMWPSDGKAGFIHVFLPHLPIYFPRFPKGNPRVVLCQHKQPPTPSPILYN